MLTNAARIDVYDDDEDEEERSAGDDYAWMLQLNVLADTDRTWRSFRAGYAVGGAIGRRRYADTRLLRAVAN